MMTLRLPRTANAKQILRRVFSSPRSADVPKGHFAVYVGEGCKQRFVVPIALLKLPSFMDLLDHAEEEFGFDHPMGGLTIPCKVDEFVDLANTLSC